MRTIRLALLLLISATAVGQSNKNDRQAEAALQAAMNKELVDGNLESAIQQYKTIVANYPKERAVVARALIQMAEAYQTLGDIESRKVFARVVHEYADQKESASLAQARLGQSATAPQEASPILRKVWSGDGGPVSRDGHLMVTYVDNDVAVHNLLDGSKRVLTKSADVGEHTSGAVLSRDGAQIAYTWYIPQTSRYELRLGSLQGAGLPSVRRLYDNEDLNSVYPMDWSPDGQWIAVTTERKNRTTQMGIVGVRDGSLRILKSTDWRGGPNDVFFSADGHYLAFDLPSGELGSPHDLFVMETDGGRQTPVVVHPSDDRVLGWSPDGKYVLFSSDRRGSKDIWALHFVNGAPQGNPELVYSNIAGKVPLGVTSAGALYLQVNGDDLDIAVTSFDVGTGKRLGPPVRPARTFLGTNSSPDWSRDGTYLAFISERGKNSDYVIVIENADTGEVVRELRPKIGYPNSLRWSPDGRAFIVSATDVKGRIGVIRIDAQTGEAVTIVAPRDDYFRGFNPEWSPDGKRIYYSLPAGSSHDVAVIERDLASGTEREVIRRDMSGGPGGAPRNTQINLSPDGRWIAGPSPDYSAVSLYPVTGGAPRELLRVGQGQTFPGPMTWAADGRGIVVNKNVPGAKQEKWFVPMSGGPPVKLDVDAPGGMRLHPDGRRLTSVVSQRRREVWVLENFLPATKKERR